jgi:hypothetical protein
VDDPGGQRPDDSQRITHCKGQLTDAQGAGIADGCHWQTSGLQRKDGQITLGISGGDRSLKGATIR